MTNPPQPDSPEDYLMTQLNRAYKLGQRHQKKKYDFQSENNATLVKSVKQIHEYYTNKFLATLNNTKNPYSQRNYERDEMSRSKVIELDNKSRGFERLRAELSQAIKQSSKRGG